MAFALGLIVVLVAYRLYAGWVDRRVIRPDPQRATPATNIAAPMRQPRSIVAGAARPGAAPAAGAIMAAQWGWLPAMLWLFAGAALFARSGAERIG